MSFDLPADPAAQPATSTLLIYLRGGQTVRLEVTDWSLNEDTRTETITKFAWTPRWPGQRMPYIRVSAIDAIVVMPADRP